MTPTNRELREFINQYFSDDELETFCFDYFREVSNDFGNGMGKNRKVIVLIGYCERRDRLTDLHAAVARERPEVWNRQFVATGVQKPGFFGETRFLTERDPRQIFLSHATADAGFAHALAKDLRAEGWKVWIAPESIRPGEKWVEAIDRGLETSGVFVVALTSAAVASRWVNTETDAAVEMQHEGVITFIPLDVADCHPKRLWRQYQRVPFQGSYEVGLDTLLRRLDGDEPPPPPPTPVREPEPPKPKANPDRRIHEKTGIELVRVPAGTFLYGANNDTMDLPEYWIGRYPVTNAQYQRFVAATRHAEPEYWKGKNPPPDKLDHPVVNISWHDAQAFCDWAGLALPIEEQWERAARGTDGRVWPWGSEWADGRCNTVEGGIGDTTPVKRYSPQGDSPSGCADMAGNVWEWTASWDDDDAQVRRVRRGGSWYSNRLNARATARHFGHSGVRGNNIGCRVVYRPPSPTL